LISNFCSVLNVVFLLLGDVLASEVYVPIFQNIVCSIFIGIVSRKNSWDEVVGLFIQEKFWLKIAWANRKEVG